MTCDPLPEPAYKHHTLWVRAIKAPSRWRLLSFGDRADLIYVQERQMKARFETVLLAPYEVPMMTKEACHRSQPKDSGE